MKGPKRASQALCPRSHSYPPGHPGNAPATQANWPSLSALVDLAGSQLEELALSPPEVLNHHGQPSFLKAQRAHVHLNIIYQNRADENTASSTKIQLQSNTIPKCSPVPMTPPLLSRNVVLMTHT